ncbi:uncharacterized protein F4807DRAFT_464352 [Annulohypoxylon truncatum]|uniref:uncharacterized protein n=1 Tax=Annulohypoxylon truncatum TaxID=327061 RepID=UPI002007DD35|nr:uncharacterized protein F4807DRAFT_464352 [Annulohypoxylon truncatum]KAI1205890.1 hypothetical protein F4807DRAFT_464352 [Annulohypoxylon truncatum]
MSANPATPEDPRPDRTTFGVELEFLVPYLYDSEVDPLGEVEGLAPLLRQTDHTGRPENEVRAVIQKLFQDHGLETEIKVYPYKSDDAMRALDRYSIWVVKDDPTVRENNDSTAWFQKYRWVDVEITSPVEPSIPITYEIINYARQLLTHTYRCRVNSSCGLHVHVGKGAERFDLVNMRRISALIWSSEHLFVNLNHPARQANFMTPTCRMNTVIATGRRHGEHDDWQPGDPLDQCMDYLAAEVRHGEEPISFKEANLGYDIREGFAKTREKGHYEPFQWKFPEGQSDEAVVPVDDNERNIDDEIEDRTEKMAAKSDFQLSTETADEPCRERTMPRMVNYRYTPDELIELGDMFGGSGSSFNRDTEDPGVFEGVRQLFNSRSSCDIAWLMFPGGRGYVNFQLYECSQFRWSQYGSGHGPKRTIEFRGAEGTLDSWAVTWAKICVGIIRFALYAPADEFMRVLMKCDASDWEFENYDCIDFLDDIGLPVEAALAEKHLKEKEWDYNIAYADEPAEPVEPAEPTEPAEPAEE